MTIATLSRYDPIKGCFVLRDFKPKPPANAFEWKRYVVEEVIRSKAQQKKGVAQ